MKRRNQKVERATIKKRGGKAKYKNENIGYQESQGETLFCFVFFIGCFTDWGKAALHAIKIFPSVSIN